MPWAVGKYSFAKVDAKQWGEWGFDYLKYDWNPIEVPQVQEMLDAGEKLSGTVRGVTHFRPPERAP